MAESRYEIIVRFLQNELSEQEVFKLDNWRKASPENEQQFLEVKFLWEKAHLTSTVNEISVDKKAALKTVHTKINEPKVVPMRRNLVQWAAAAAVLLLIGGGVGYNLFFSQAEVLHFATALNEQKEITLPDNSKVWINENSKLSYAANFDGETREIQLEGDATFEVTSDKFKPFIVHTNDIAVSVLGTKFNVYSPKKSTESEVHVLHGKVKVASKENDERQIILTKGLTARFDRNKNQLALIEDFVPNRLFEDTRTLIFKNQKLELVFAEIETAYKVNIDLVNENMLQCPFTGKFENQNIAEVLEIMQTLFDFKISKQDSLNYKITQGSCN